MRLLSCRQGTPPTCTANRWTILRTRLEIWIHRQLNRLGVPGAIQPIDFTDALTGTRIQIQSGVLFFVININGRDFYFDRITGRFDGTGSMQI